jgi:mono/diheme cytochrome c family protein
MKLLVPTLCLLAVILSGCSGPQRVPPIEVWPDMKRDGKFKAQMETTLFTDGRASRRPVAGTIARGNDRDDAYATGISGDTYIGQNPLPIDADTLALGQARFNTYCSPCHSRVGDGKGIVALRTPSWQPANLHDPRILNQSDGEIFNTVSYGRRSMPGYRFQMTDHDRWAIVAYLRALQRTTNGAMDDVPRELQSELK